MPISVLDTKDMKLRRPVCSSSADFGPGKPLSVHVLNIKVSALLQTDGREKWQCYLHLVAPLLPSGMELARIYLLLPEERSVINCFPCAASFLCVRQIRSQVSQSRKSAKDTDPKEFACFACDHKDAWFNMLEDCDPRHKISGRFWMECCSHSHWYKAVGSFLVITEV